MDIIELVSLPLEILGFMLILCELFFRGVADKIEFSIIAFRDKNKTLLTNLIVKLGYFLIRQAETNRLKRAINFVDANSKIIIAINMLCVLIFGAYVLGWIKYHYNLNGVLIDIFYTIAIFATPYFTPYLYIFILYSLYFLYKICNHIFVTIQLVWILIKLTISNFLSRILLFFNRHTNGKAIGAIGFIICSSCVVLALIKTIHITAFESMYFVYWVGIIIFCLILLIGIIKVNRKLNIQNRLINNNSVKSKQIEKKQTEQPFSFLKSALNMIWSILKAIFRITS